MTPNSSVEHCTRQLTRLRLGTTQYDRLSDADQKLQNAMYLAEMQKVHGDSVRDAVDVLLADCDGFPSVKKLTAALWQAERKNHPPNKTLPASSPIGGHHIPPIRQDTAVRIVHDIAANRGTLAGPAIELIGRAMLERSGYDEHGRPTESNAA